MAVRKIDNFDEFISEYVRVRGWLNNALSHTREFIEQEVLLGLVARKFVLWVSDNSAAVAQIADVEDRTTCLLVLVGGAKGKALREIMIEGQEAIIGWAKANGCVRLQGTPRKEWSRLLLNNGFEVNNKNDFYKDI